MKSSAKKSRKVSSETAALNFFAEAGLLKRVKRSGWWVAGIENPETVAEHCFRCAVIGYYIAHGEGVDPFKVVTMTLFNDIHEARINDLHKMGHHYIEFRLAEQKVFADQIAHLEDKVKAALQAMRQDYDRQLSRESIVARDADILECLIQAKEYVDNGYPVARTFFKRAPDYLKTTTARQLWKKAISWDSHAWWQNVVKFER
ncbi:MAG: HD domain-containing protein [Candidatus Omnitrophica bacterium]|nr:HD domain-containing protein [Candidatus Omnitrophota bacterium]MDE2222392.1 HD domain-containing protein [Candidatus Omnitrophota bacterium]